jgi:hydroxymethylpyrimidine/phosphomethylpyrimidine kinase
VTSDLRVDAVKTGMLARPATVRAVAALAAAGRLPNLVVDPVLVSSTGHLLMEEGGVDAYRDDLLRHAVVTTPNLRETALLAGVDVASLTSTDAMATAGRALLALGPSVVVVKGGHLLRGAATEASAPDVVVCERGTTTLEAARVDTQNDHGTGCSLAAAIAAGLAEGLEPLEAITRAKGFVRDALAGARTWRLGAGHGRIDHFGWGP